MVHFLFECNVRVWWRGGMNNSADECECNCTFVRVVCNYVYNYILNYGVNETL